MRSFNRTDAELKLGIVGLDVFDVDPFNRTDAELKQVRNDPLGKLPFPFNRTDAELKPLLQTAQVNVSPF